MNRLLDGPDFFPLRALSPRRGAYRSVTLALYAWGFGWAERFLTRATLALLPVMLLVGLYCTVAIDSPIRIFLPVFAAAAAVELGIGWWFRVRVRIRRAAPRLVRRGTEFQIRYELTNRRGVRAFDVVCDPFSYGSGIRVLDPAGVGELPPRGRAVVQARCRAEKRGVYRLYRPIAESAFPLELKKWSCRDGAADHLAVYPDYFPLLSFTLPVGAATQHSGMANIARIGESPDLLGTREYRDGDEIRHIDWPGSARRGKLVVKEYEEERLRRAALIVDTRIRRPRLNWRGGVPASPALEAALSLAAALTAFLVKNDTAVDLFAAGSEVHHLAVGRNRGSFEQVCELLAAVEPDYASALPAEVFRELGETGAAVVLLLDDDPERRRFIESLHAAGVATRVLLLNPDVPSPPADWVAVEPAAVRNGAVREL